jgi:hypothetical protein
VDLTLSFGIWNLDRCTDGDVLAENIGDLVCISG